MDPANEGGQVGRVTANPRRRFNDDRRRLFGAAGRLIAFVCECGDPHCHDSVLLTAADYEARRPGLIVHDRHATDTRQTPAREPP